MKKTIGVFRKKPINIFAEQFVDYKNPPEGVTKVDGFFCVATLEGTMMVSLGDWVITGVAGEMYPCKPEIFEATYEEI